MKNTSYNIPAHAHVAAVSTPPVKPAGGCYSTMNMYGVGGQFQQTIFPPTPVSTNFEYRYPGKASIASIQRQKSGY
jgi:hypothetical protein